MICKGSTGVAATEPKLAAIEMTLESHPVCLLNMRPNKCANQSEIARLESIGSPGACRKLRLYTKLEPICGHGGRCT
jgi:hypothetical protein